MKLIYSFSKYLRSPYYVLGKVLRIYSQSLQSRNVKTILKGVTRNQRKILPPKWYQKKKRKEKEKNLFRACVLESNKCEFKWQVYQYLALSPFLSTSFFICKNEDDYKNLCQQDCCKVQTQTAKCSDWVMSPQ